MRNLLTLLAGILSFITLSAHANEPSAAAFTLNTTAFLDQGAMPILYTCDGKNISPEFDWDHVPSKTQSLAFILSDPDAPSGTFYHWIVYDIPASVNGFNKDIKELPAGSMTGKNSFGNLKYDGPCPPKGAAHTYIFTLYALDKKLKLPVGSDGKTVLDLIQKHILDKVERSATYGRRMK